MLRKAELQQDLQDSGATAEEMSGVIIGVETHEIAVQYAIQNLVADGQDSIDFATGEGCVQEESELDVALSVTNLFAEHGRQEHQVVIVHPNQVVVLDIFCNLLGEEPVGFAVCVPCGLVEGDLTGVVVEQGPQN